MPFWTYESRALAAKLQENCVHGSRIVLLLPSEGIEYVLGFLACLYAGVVAVPAYPLGPTGRGRDRLAAIMGDSEPVLVLSSTGEFGEKGSGPGVIPARPAVIVPESIGLEFAENWREPSIEASSVAFLQYTSGSTRTPRGVVVTHGNLLANERIIQTAFQQNERSIVVGWLPLFHDMGLVGNILQSLYSGACGILMSPEAFLHRPVRWLEAISRYRGTTSGGPDFAYRLCVERIRQEDVASLDLSSWTVAFNGAEPIRASTMQRFAERFGLCGFSRNSFLPCYGLAEATLLVTGSRSSTGPKTRAFDTDRLRSHLAIDSNSDEPEKRRELVSCGPASVLERIAIVEPDGARRRCQNGVGEIWISGPNVAQGYYNNLTLTEQTFQAKIEGEAGCYLRTGDLGFVAEGQLYVTGRVKDLINIRGENHYPQDIELTASQSCSELESHRNVVFTIDAEDEHIALVQEVGKHGAVDFSALTDKVRQAVSREHGLFLHDIVFVKKGTIPITSSGKVQRQECRSRLLGDTLEILSRHRYSADLVSEVSGDVDLQIQGHATNEVEKYLIVNVARLAGRKPSEINAELGLDAAGLDSLSLAWLKNDIEERWGVSLSVSQFSPSVSVRTLAALVQELRNEQRHQLNADVDPRVPIESEHREAGPLSIEQQRIWLLEQLHKKKPSYNLSAVAGLTGPLDKNALDQALNGLLERHTSLRTVFVEGPVGPMQRILPTGHARITFETRFCGDEAEKCLAIDGALDEEREYGFDLEAGPLIRFRVLTLANNEHKFIITTHHIVADVWSLGILIRDFLALYRGAESSLPRRRFDYLHYANLRCEPTASPTTVTYWTKQFERPSYELSWKRSKPRKFGGGPQREFFAIPREIASELRVGATRAGHTLFTRLLSAFVAVMSVWSRRQDIVVGVPLWGRNEPGTTDIVGLFAYPTLLRVSFDKQMPIGELEDLVHEKLLGAGRHQGLSLGRILELAQNGADKGPQWKIPFLFSLLPGVALSRVLDGVGSTLEKIDGGDQDVEFLVALEEREEELRGRISFDSQIYGIGDVRNFLTCYVETLERFIREPKTTIEDLDLAFRHSFSSAKETKHSICVASTFTAEPLHEIFAFWAGELGIDLSVSFAPFGQVFQELLGPNGVLGTNQNGTNIVIVRLRDLLPKSRNSSTDANEHLKKATAEFVDAVRVSVSHSAAPHLVCLAASGEKTDDDEGVESYISAEETVRAALDKVPGVSVITSLDVDHLYPVSNRYDEATDEVGHIPFTRSYFASVGSTLMRRMYGLYGPRYKAIVTDCDGTLWVGACGEVGPSGVEIDQPRRALQELLRKQCDQGVLLCLCSKNNPEDVWSVFDARSELPLKRSDFAAERINWRQKSENILEIASELGLREESLIFIDDNAIECADIEANCPSVLSIQLPEDSTDSYRFLSRLWALDSKKTSPEDAARLGFYAQERNRNANVRHQLLCPILYEGWNFRSLLHRWNSPMSLARRN